MTTTPWWGSGVLTLTAVAFGGGLSQLFTVLNVDRTEARERKKRHSERQNELLRLYISAAHRYVDTTASADAAPFYSAWITLRLEADPSLDEKVFHYSKAVVDTAKRGGLIDNAEEDEEYVKLMQVSSTAELALIDEVRTLQDLEPIEGA